MPFPTFNPPVAPAAATNEPKLKILKAEFGDGYVQTAPDGLNFIKDEVELTWSALRLSDANAIEGFLRARGGHEPFRYAIPQDSTKVWRCEKWRVDHLTNEVRAITATFTQDFSLGG